jgi:hypothetical protein
MAQTFKVTAVSPKTKPWSGTYGDMVDFYVKLEGQDAPVVVTKKAGNQGPQVGDELFGTLDMGGKFGPKFKAERQQFGGGGSAPSGGGGGSKPSYQPKDEKAIQAMWAIGQAVSAVGPITDKKQPVADYALAVETVASELFALVDVIKTGGKIDTPEAYTIADAPDVVKKPDMSELDEIFGASDTIPVEDEVPFP